MAVNGAGDIFGAGAELHGQDTLGDHVGRTGADDVNAQHPVGAQVDAEPAVAGGDVVRGAAGDLAQALENFRRVVEGYGGTRAADEAMVAIARIEAMRSQDRFSADPNAPLEEIVVLPLQIRTGLSGILYDDVRPTCCIGPFIFAEGDTVDPFDVTILEIHQEEVVFRYRDRQFTVPVVPN